MVLLGAGLFVTMDAYRGYTFRSEREVLVNVLERARNSALYNIDQTAWGVCYDDAAPQYVLFRGASYVAGAATNEGVPAQKVVSMHGLPLCSSGSAIEFSQLTGSLSPPVVPATSEFVITIVENNRSGDISINNEGRINW